jgi:hypothetical protein
MESRKITTTKLLLTKHPLAPRIPMIVTTIQKQIQKVLHKDYVDGEFDASIKLPPQSQKPEYLFGYYNGKNVPF